MVLKEDRNLRRLNVPIINEIVNRIFLKDKFEWWKSKFKLNYWTRPILSLRGWITGMTNHEIAFYKRWIAFEGMELLISWFLNCISWNIIDSFIAKRSGAGKRLNSQFYCKQLIVNCNLQLRCWNLLNCVLFEYW